MINEGDADLDIVGHQVGQAIDAIRILREFVQQETGKQVDLGPLEASIVKIDAARAQYPKPEGN